MTVKYISSDGKEFSSESDCLAYEGQTKNLLLSIKFYDGRKRIKLNSVDNLEKCYDNATRCIFPSIEAKREMRRYVGFCARTKEGELESYDDCKHLKYRVNASKLCWEQDEEVE